MPQPVMINMMREPMARETSSFYYNMWGPRPDVDMVKARLFMMNMTGLDHPPTINEYTEWVATQPEGAGCIDTIGGQQQPRYNLQTRFFCGFHPACTNICSDEALAIAKRAMVKEYAVVGLLEKLPQMLMLLELELPEWFAYLGVEYGRMLERADHGRLRTHTKAHHEPLSPQNLELMKMHNGQDVKLYEFASARFTAAGRRHGLDW
jgi:hypothetical protein